MKILYFASLREKIGKANEELQGFENVLSLKKHLITKYPNCFDESIITAVNMEVVTDDLNILESDEIAFYPPVTGG
jgi:molybdopterin synthase sulfur carrier subunit